jgi:hypothetical protein
MECKECNVSDVKEADRMTIPWRAAAAVVTEKQKSLGKD